MNTVKSVKIIKTGTGKKGPWTMYGVTLDNGQEASGFDEVRDGDTVETEQNGKYTNYTVVSRGNGASAPAAKAATNGSNGNGSYDANRSSRIERQHSQEMALRYFGLVGGFPEGKTATEALREMASWFQRDIAKSPVTEAAEASTMNGIDL